MNDFNIRVLVEVAVWYSFMVWVYGWVRVWGLVP